MKWMLADMELMSILHVQLGGKMKTGVGLRLPDVLWLGLLLPALAWSGTFNIPETVVANSDGSFAFNATYTAGPGETFGHSWVTNVDNTDVIGPIADGICLMPLTEGAVYQISPMGVGGIAGRLLDPTLPGMVRIEYSACGGGSVRTGTTILPYGTVSTPTPTVTPPPPPPICPPLPAPPEGCTYNLTTCELICVTPTPTFCGTPGSSALPECSRRNYGTPKPTYKPSPKPRPSGGWSRGHDSD